MKKKANLSFTVLITLLVICCGAALLTVVGNSKYNAKSEYEKVETRYITESGIDMSVGLFLNYLSNRDLALTYTKKEGGGYSVISDYSPYLLDEIRTSMGMDIVRVGIIENECKDYLASVGFLDFLNEGSIEVAVYIYGDKESFKITQMCTQPEFLLSKDEETGGNKKSRINPIFLTVRAKYRGGEIIADVKISEIYAVRTAFSDVEIGEMGSVPAWIDTSSAKIEYENYQNYRGI